MNPWNMRTSKLLSQQVSYPPYLFVEEIPNMGNSRYHSLILFLKSMTLWLFLLLINIEDQFLLCCAVL